MYHATLERQLKKYLSGQALPKYLLPFLQAVSDTYSHADEDQRLAERSLEISSKELGEINAHLLEEKNRLEEKAVQLELANNVMVGRELKMIELKKTIERLTSASNQKQTRHEIAPTQPQATT